MQDLFYEKEAAYSSEFLTFLWSILHWLAGLSIHAWS